MSRAALLAEKEAGSFGWSKVQIVPDMGFGSDELRDGSMRTSYWEACDSPELRSSAVEAMVVYWLKWSRLRWP